MTPVHATAVAIGAHAVLLTGASGRGKSDLALRLIDRGAVLIADDQVLLDTQLHASPPPTLAGLIEVRGVGIIRLPWAAGIAVALIADLDAVPERLPEPMTRVLLGRTVPVVALTALEPSAPLKLERALRLVVAAVEARS